MFRRMVFVLALAACGAPTGPSPQDELAAARARWEAQRMDSYEFELTRMCLCIFGGRVVTVRVEAGAVAAANYADSNTAVEAALLSYLPTIPDLFDLIEDALEQHAARVMVQYDASTGHPTHIELDYSLMAIDDEFTYEVAKLVPLREAVR
ncbi:MAG: DUF6174 domain-containing protein [Gemmatimonadales bacterium]